MVQAAKPQSRSKTETKIASGQKGRNRNDGLTDELRRELRAMIARRASLYRELEKH